MPTVPIDRATATEPAPADQEPPMSRRHLLRLIGLGGATAVVAGTGALRAALGSRGDPDLRTATRHAVAVVGDVADTGRRAADGARGLRAVGADVEARPGEGRRRRNNRRLAGREVRRGDRCRETRCERGGCKQPEISTSAHVPAHLHINDRSATRRSGVDQGLTWPSSGSRSSASRTCETCSSRRRPCCCARHSAGRSC